VIEEMSRATQGGDCRDNFGDNECSTKETARELHCMAYYLLLLRHTQRGITTKKVFVAS
jgi:hypothetical protein